MCRYKDRGDLEDCISPLRVQMLYVTVSFGPLYSFRLRQAPVSAIEGVYQECTLVHLSLYVRIQ